MKHNLKNLNFQEIKSYESFPSSTLDNSYFFFCAKQNLLEFHKKIIKTKAIN